MARRKQQGGEGGVVGQVGMGDRSDAPTTAGSSAAFDADVAAVVVDTSASADCATLDSLQGGQVGKGMSSWVQS